MRQLGSFPGHSLIAGPIGLLHPDVKVIIVAGDAAHERPVPRLVGVLRREVGVDLGLNRRVVVQDAVFSITDEMGIGVLGAGFASSDLTGSFDVQGFEEPFTLQGLFDTAQTSLTDSVFLDNLGLGLTDRRGIRVRAKIAVVSTRW